MVNQSALGSAKLVLATHNTHKLEELRQILRPLIPGFSDEMVVSAAGLGVPEPVEDGTSFAENSLIKARALVEATGLPAVADDSGLCVDILGGAPGIFSARWCGHHGDDKANLELLLNQLSEVSDPHRRGAFVCAAALVLPDGTEIVELGEMPGHLGFEPVGANGFGYDPIFYPDGFDVTSAELEPEEKNRISHRGQAFRQLAGSLVKIFEADN